MGPVTPKRATSVPRTNTQQNARKNGSKQRDRYPAGRQRFTTVPRPESEGRNPLLARSTVLTRRKDRFEGPLTGGSLHRTTLIQNEGCQQACMCSNTCTSQDRNSSRQRRGEAKCAGNEWPSTRSIGSSSGQVAGQHARGFLMGSRSVDRRPSSWHGPGIQKEPTLERRGKPRCTQQTRAAVQACRY